MSQIIVSEVRQSNTRELSNVVDDLKIFTLPIIDINQGHLLAMYGVCITVDQHGETMMLNLGAAWQEVTDLAKAFKRAKRAFPVGLNMRYDNVEPGFAIQLHPEDAATYGVEYSYVQPYSAQGYPMGDPIDGCIALTQKAAWRVMQEAKMMPEFEMLAESNAQRPDNTVSFGNLKASVAHVKQHGPVEAKIVRTINDVKREFDVLSFPKGGQRERVLAQQAETIQQAQANSRVAQLMAKQATRK